jgi:hypothetical protein
MALGLIAAVSVGIVLVITRLLTPVSTSPYVSYTEVERALAPPSTGTASTSTGTAPTTGSIPENVRRALEGNEKVLDGWLDVLRPDEHEAFLQNLSVVISESEAKKASLIPVVNTMKRLYFERRDTILGPYAASAKRTVLLTELLLMAGLGGLFVLVLVLLAVERHVREQPTPGSSSAHTVTTTA